MINISGTTLLVTRLRLIMTVGQVLMKNTTESAEHQSDDPKKQEEKLKIFKWREIVYYDIINLEKYHKRGGFWIEKAFLSLVQGWLADGSRAYCGHFTIHSFGWAGTSEECNYSDDRWYRLYPYYYRSLV